MFKFITTTNFSDITDSSHTVGVEVTTPDVAALCHVNIDGQHGTGKCAYDGVALGMWLQQTMNYHPAQDAAIAIATHVMVPAQFRRALPELRDPAAPPATPFDDWTTFVTTRPDLDSIGAMAVLVIRSLGSWPEEGTRAEDAIRDRVRAIAEADAFTPTAEWVPSPLPTNENPWPRAGSADSTEGLAHLGMICSPRRGDVALPLAERVAIIACWLLWGENMYLTADAARAQAADAIWRACGLGIEALYDQADEMNACSDWALLRTERVITQARDLVMQSRRALTKEAQRPGAVVGEGGIAVVRVAHAGAMGLGYCGAPVVVAFDQANQGKVTIAAYAAKYLDVPALKARLNALEPGWGGGATIIGSPQGVGTKLPDETIIAHVRACRS